MESQKTKSSLTLILPNFSSCTENEMSPVREQALAHRTQRSYCPMIFARVLMYRSLKPIPPGREEKK